MFEMETKWQQMKKQLHIDNVTPGILNQNSKTSQLNLQLGSFGRGMQHSIAKKGACQLPCMCLNLRLLWGGTWQKQWKALGAPGYNRNISQGVPFVLVIPFDFRCFWLKTQAGWKIQISEGLPNSLSSFLGPSRVEHNYLEYWGPTVCWRLARYNMKLFGSYRQVLISPCHRWIKFQIYRLPMAPWSDKQKSWG